MRGTPGPAPPAATAAPVATAAFAEIAVFDAATVPAGVEPPVGIRLFGPGMPGREAADPGVVERPGVVDVVDDM
ncbi:hypothetical protein ACFRCG_35585 [Embleya sp. NPDC056575]|uniref:hypothetical protein n=1 Tax=unclassified Embleya TaxID=2699296 RepID=UPI0036824D18